MKIDINEISELLFGLFQNAGLIEEDARISADCLITAEMAGITSHGVSMAPSHLKKCINGYNVKASLTIEKSNECFTVYNANNSIGMVSAWKCVQQAMNMAKKNGVHLVLCNNANTFSAAYCYAKQAVNDGMIIIVSCNSPAQMAPLGGNEKLLGTNPIAIGIPAKEEKPFILDMATSIVAKSKINDIYRNGGTYIPDGWATDSKGFPTNSPQEAVNGLIMPMAGPKGYGLSMAADIINGVLSHASYLDSIKRFFGQTDCMNVGHAFLAIDPKIIYGDQFYSIMDDYLSRIRNSHSINEDKILVPGDINIENELSSRKHGLEISDELYDELRSMFCIDAENWI